MIESKTMVERAIPDYGSALREIAKGKRKQLMTLGVIPERAEKIKRKIESPALAGITGLFEQMIKLTGNEEIEYGSRIQLTDGELKLEGLIEGEKDRIRVANSGDSFNNNFVGVIHYHPTSGQFSLYDLLIFTVPVETTDTQLRVVIGKDGLSQVAIKLGFESIPGIVFHDPMRELELSAIREVQKQIPFRHMRLDRIPFLEMYVVMTGKTDYIGKPKDGSSSKIRNRLLEEAFLNQFLNHYGICIYEAKTGSPTFIRKA